MAKTPWMNESEIEQLMSREPGRSVRTPAVASTALDGTAMPLAGTAMPSDASALPLPASPPFLAAECEEPQMATEHTMSPRDAAELLRMCYTFAGEVVDVQALLDAAKSEKVVASGA